MNYPEAVQYLLSLGRELAAPTQAAATKFNLENITALLQRLGRPDRAFPSVHIAGTNGKGSTAAFLESILRRAGFRTGLNTSPHLERINERIRINGEEISDELFAATFTRIHTAIEELLAENVLRAHPTYFECVTALAFEAFAHERVDFAVIEVGLGGRLDATNVLTPKVSIITSIDFDHEEFLGHSLREIAGEKAGILKYGTPAVIAPQPQEARDVLLAKASELHCPVIEIPEAFRIEAQKMVEGCIHAAVLENASDWRFEIAPQLPGAFQLQNALNAVAAARILQTNDYKISDSAILEGIRAASWPGRLEKISSKPDIYLDGAHNPAAARELARFLEENFRHRRIILVFGSVRDKAVDEIAGLLFPLAQQVILTAPPSPRAVSATQLERLAGHHASHYSVEPDAGKALEAALAATGPDDVVFLTGSLYLVGHLRRLLRTRSKTASEL